GLIGFLVLLLVFAPPIAAVARRARSELTAVGAFGGAIYFVVHACVDWIWTIPAVGALAMVVLSIGASSAAEEPRAVTRRSSLAARYLYGINLLKLHKLRLAHEQLFEAHRLSPKDPFVTSALRLAPYARPPR